MKPKNKIKLLEKAIELASLIIKLQLSKTDYKGTPPIPDYRKGYVNKGCSEIVSDGKAKETVVTPDGKEILLKGKPIIFEKDENHYKETIITPTGVKIRVSNELSNFLTTDVSVSVKYKCLSEISKDIDIRLKEIDNSMGKNTDGGGNYPYKKIWDYWSNVLNSNPIAFEGGRNSGRTHFYEEWSKKLNEYLKEKGLNNTEPFGFAPIEDKEPKTQIKTPAVEQWVNILDNTTFSINEIEKHIEKIKTPIALPLGFSHDFHKQAVEAEKECNHYRRKIDNYYVNAYHGSPTITTVICLDCGLDLTVNERQKLKQRHLEIGKEIEKLRNEARTIKNQLKDSK